MRQPNALIALRALAVFSVLTLGPAAVGNPLKPDGSVLAQAGAPSGRGSTTGDPAASSATPGSAPTTGNAMKPNPSGSGTSTSGGRYDNGDRGRDKMPESNMSVRPNNQPGRR
jgi:hypothetical protein